MPEIEKLIVTMYHKKIKVGNSKIWIGKSNIEVGNSDHKVVKEQLLNLKFPEQRWKFQL